MNILDDKETALTQGLYGKDPLYQLFPDLSRPVIHPKPPQISLDELLEPHVTMKEQPYRDKRHWLSPTPCHTLHRLLKDHPLKDLPPTDPHFALGNIRGASDFMQVFPDTVFGRAAQPAETKNNTYETPALYRTMECRDARAETVLWLDSAGEPARRITFFEPYMGKPFSSLTTALPAIMDETYSGGVRRHVIVHSHEAGRGCEKFFDAEGRLHREGAPAMVERYNGHELHEWRQNGLPHRLDGPWREGHAEGAAVMKPVHDNWGSLIDHKPVENGDGSLKKERGARVEPEYAIRGKTMSKEEFYAHPEVIAARGGAMQRLSRFLGVFGSDDAAPEDDALGAMRRQDRALRLTTLLGKQPPTVQSAVLGRLAGLAPGIEGAAALEACRLRDIAAFEQGREAARNLAAATARIDGALKDVAAVREDMAQLPAAQDALDGLTKDVLQHKANVQAQADAANRQLDDARHDAATDKTFAQAQQILREGGATPALLRALADHHAALPDPLRDARDWQAAADRLNARADRLLEEVPQRMQAARDEVMKALNFLDAKHGSGNQFSKWVSAPSAAPAAPSEAPVARAQKPRP